MTRHAIARIALATLISTTPFIAAQTQQPKPAPNAQGKPAVKTASAQHQEEGGKKFDANCSRCHNAPENLNPRITGTVLRHMRIRANLSAQDEKDILRYLSQ
jgi:cytochrome c5